MPSPAGKTMVLSDIDVGETEILTVVISMHFALCPIRVLCVTACVHCEFLFALYCATSAC